MVSSCRQWRLWSDWGDAQADLCLCWVHMLICWFCHVVAKLLLIWQDVKTYLGNYWIKIILKFKPITDFIIRCTGVVCNSQIDLRCIGEPLVPCQILIIQNLPNDAGIRPVLGYQGFMKSLPVRAIPVWFCIQKNWSEHSPGQRGLKHANKEKSSSLVWPKWAKFT